MLCVFLEGRKRKYILLAGIIIDLVLFIVCRNLEMLLIGLVGGILCGIVPIEPRKYETAIHEMKGIKNLLLVSIIFFIMIFMVFAIAYPGLKIQFTK